VDCYLAGGFRDLRPLDDLHPLDPHVNRTRLASGNFKQTKRFVHIPDDCDSCDTIKIVRPEFRVFTQYSFQVPLTRSSDPSRFTKNRHVHVVCLQSAARSTGAYAMHTHMRHGASYRWKV